MNRHVVIAILTLFLTLIFVTKTASAAECTIIYGGGVIDCSKITPTPLISPTTQTPQKKQTETKGGFAVQKTSTPSTTPATGPEAFGLISLIPAAAAGFYLRRKTK